MIVRFDFDFTDADISLLDCLWEVAACHISTPRALGVQHPLSTPFGHRIYHPPTDDIRHVIWLPVDARIASLLRFQFLNQLLCHRYGPVIEVSLRFDPRHTHVLIVAIVHRIRSVAKANARSSPLYNVYRIVAGTGITYTLTSLALLLSSFMAARNPFPLLLCDSIVRLARHYTHNLSS